LLAIFRYYVQALPTTSETESLRSFNGAPYTRAFLFFSSKSRSTSSPSLQALSQSTYNTYKSVRHNFFDILGRRPSSSFNNPYFCREKVSAGNGQHGDCACSSTLANYKL